MFERCVFIIHNDTELHSAAQALKRSNCIPPRLAPLRCTSSSPLLSPERSGGLHTLRGDNITPNYINRKGHLAIMNFQAKCGKQAMILRRFPPHPPLRQGAGRKWIGALPWQRRAVTWRIKEIDELSGLVLINNQSHMQKVAGILGYIQLIICLFLTLIRGLWSGGGAIITAFNQNQFNQTFPPIISCSWLLAD